MCQKSRGRALQFTCNFSQNLNLRSVPVSEGSVKIPGEMIFCWSNPKCIPAASPPPSPSGDNLVWFDLCFTALQHILGHFGRGQLAYPYCS